MTFLRRVKLLLPLLGAVAAQNLTSSLVRVQVVPLPCPDACEPGKPASEWTFIHDAADLAVCPEPIIFDFGLYSNVANNGHFTIRACTLGDAETHVNFLADTGFVAEDASGKSNFGPVVRRAATLGAKNNGTLFANTTTCGVGPPSLMTKTAFSASWKSSRDPSISNSPAEDLSQAVRALEQHLSSTADATAGCDKTTVVFAHVHGAIIGLFSGGRMEQKKTSPALLGVFSEILHQDGPSDQRALEICDAQSSTGDIFGIVADPTGDFAFVQKIMRSWNEAKCVSVSATDSGPATTSEHETDVWGFPTPPVLDDTEPAALSVTPRGVRMPLLRPRADCRTIQAEANDDCTKLAARCGIGKTAFASFNKASGDICSGSIPQGQTVCCSSGSLPIGSGTGTGGGSGVGGVCTYYDIQADEGCFAVASKHGITVEELESFNKKTWGWDGCGSGLQISQRICVSSGRPPLASPDPVAVCGPAVVGTVDPGDGTPVEELNMCPLNACCSNWGYCGLTEEFCTIARLPSGNPGTSQPGKNSCLSNCGMKMTNNGQAPAQFRKVGYFQGWNYNRPCGHMHVREIDSSYTHVHFAFGEFGSDLQVFIPQDAKTQWEAFKAAKQIQKKILAFGGWDFSNMPATSGRFRQAVSGANRETFATNVVKFAVENGIDGLDFDWEYPGATDIVGSDPGQKEDGDNYYEFLKLVRAKLPSDKSLSIATAASYWYLRGFPIKKMSEILSYIVYMTYDLHGQWDVGNKHASPGCGAGNCLRSHINSTETYNSLVMITKAGVESHKVVVGVSSYGRSFKMADATCRGPQCTFLGDSANSPAKKGRCTGTGGYIADFEIEEIIKKGGAIKTWYDAETDSDYLVYEGTEWVAYMKPETKEKRTAYYKGLNFGGTTDWAIDLQSGRNLDGSGDDYPVVYLDSSVYNQVPAQCYPPCRFVFPPSPVSPARTISIPPYTTSLQVGGGTTKTITVTPPVLTVTSMSYYNMIISSGQDTATIAPYQSIDVPQIITVVDDQTRTLLLPPWPLITNGPPDSWNFTLGPGGETVTSVPVIPLPTSRPTFPWPSDVSIEPVETPVPDEGEDDDGDGGLFVSTCKLWFFFACIKWDYPFDINIQGWRWKLPVGTIPPGPPPPRIKFPPGIEIRGALPPWPEITVHPGGRIEAAPKPADCTLAEAYLCTTKTYAAITVEGGMIRTATSTTETCATITGCQLRDVEASVTVTGCTLKPTAHAIAERAGASGPDVAELTGAVEDTGDVKFDQRRKRNATPAQQLAARQDDNGGDGSCALPSRPGGNWSGKPELGPEVTFRPGPAEPICSTSCGTLCDEGFYCDVHPTGTPPDFTTPAPDPTSPPISGLPHPTITPAPTGTGGPIPSNCASATTWSNCAGGACQTYSDCGATFIDCKTSNARPGDGINKGYCVCGGSTFPQSPATAVNGDQKSCGYTSKPTITTNPVDEGPKTTNTAECKVCSVVGHNNMDCTSLANCTPEPTTTTKEPEPAPTPSGEVCLAGWGQATIGSNDFGYVVFKGNDLCGRDSVRVDDFATDTACDLARRKIQFTLCGKKVWFEESGPSFGTIGCGLQLVVDGKKYSGVEVDSMAAPCHGVCTKDTGPGFGSGMGLLKFSHVPMCE